VIAAAYDIAIGCGWKSMSRVPRVLGENGPGRSVGPLMMERYSKRDFQSGNQREMLAGALGDRTHAIDEYSSKEFGAAPFQWSGVRFEACIPSSCVRPIFQPLGQHLGADALIGKSRCDSAPIIAGRTDAPARFFATNPSAPHMLSIPQRWRWS